VLVVHITSTEIPITAPGVQSESGFLPSALQSELFVISGGMYSPAFPCWPVRLVRVDLAGCSAGKESVHTKAYTVQRNIKVIRALMKVQCLPDGCRYTRMDSCQRVSARR